MNADADGGGVAVTAEGFGLRGPRGWAFRDVGLDAEPGSLIVIEGPSGSGRTSLLLALTGRMRSTHGTATVGTARLPGHLAAVRRISALAHVAGVTDLDPALTVGEHLRERALLERRFAGSVRELLWPRSERAAGTKRCVDAALAAAGLDPEALPKGSRTAVRDLERLEALRLSVALALIGRPRLLGVDDADLKLSEDERADVHALFATLIEAGTTVIAVCGEAPDGAVTVATRGPRHEPADADADRDGTPDRDGKADREAPPGTDGTDSADETNNTDGTNDTDGTDDTDSTDDKEGPADALAETGRA
ncbi:ATP-binding cassette domain-containing protein [Streptomyces sp. NPDC059894]|uniref:ATP-binding cassette domain-containing protein n=1 Tax=unclassified Streptomyces TaxID=2593676 RepID=UPI00365CFEF1